MTATEQKWAERIAAWRESGLTSEKFSEGREFSAHGLRQWAYRLGLTERRRRKPKVRIARVVRAAAPAPTDAKEITRDPVPAQAPLIVEFDGARVVVRPGFDRATLAVLLEVLVARGGAR
jgi:hypothetical protein